MSHPSPSAHEVGTSHDDNHDATHSDHGSLRGYLTGFVLAALLTIIPFWLVLGHVIASPQVTIVMVLGLAAVQIVVHMIFFLQPGPAP